MSQKNILGEGVVEHTPAATDHCLALPRDVVGERYTWRKIVVVFVVKLIGGNVQPGCGIKPEEEPILFPHHAKVVPAHTQIQG